MLPPAELSPGTVLSDTYEVVELLGTGGMGAVWKAKHLRLPGKMVAVKVLKGDPGTLSPEALARFRREAEVASRINHPNIVQMLDYATLPSGSPFLVMECLTGESLAARLSRGPLSLDEALALARQVGSALAAAHQEGVVHRDLKPDNIFLVPDLELPGGTRARVLDFGISKIQGGASMATKDQVMGTPQYMSPEQALGKNADVDARADVFALAAILYESLCGKSAFGDDNVANVLFRVAYQPHAPLAPQVPSLPDRVIAAIERGLEKDPTKRWPSVAALVEQLTGAPLPMLPSAPPLGPGMLATPAASTPSVLYGATHVPSGSQKALEQPKPAALARPRWVAPVVVGGVGFLLALAAVLVFLRPSGGSLQASAPLARVEAPSPVDVAPTDVASPRAQGLAEPVVEPVPSPVVEERAPQAEPRPRAEVGPRVEVGPSYDAAELRSRLGPAEAALARGKPADAERLAKRLLPELPVAAHGPVYALLVRSACVQRDHGNARRFLRQLEDRALKKEARQFCKQVDFPLD